MANVPYTPQTLYYHHYNQYYNYHYYFYYYNIININNIIITISIIIIIKNFMISYFISCHKLLVKCLFNIGEGENVIMMIDHG